MRIKPIVRNRVLTNISGFSAKKGGNLPNYAVMLYCNDRGKVYYITTDMTTTCLDMKDGMFHDPDKSVTMNIARSADLHRLIEECQAWAEENADKSIDFVKNGLQKLVRGDAVRKGAGKEVVNGVADRMEELAETKRDSTKTLYQQTARRIRKYGGNIPVDELTPQWLEDWEKSLREEGLAVNGIGRLMRDLRHTVNWCVENGYSNNATLFKRYKIKAEIKRQDALTGQDIADFRDYPCEPWQEQYRDMVMLSFYLCGINTGDLLLCTQLERGRRFVYTRQKTGAQGDVWVCDEAWEIIQKYKGDKWLLSWMDNRAGYRSFGRSCDDALKKYGLRVLSKDRLGQMRKVAYYPIFSNMTIYTFRRSFASIASNELDIPKETIAQCLTHSWADVTERYIYRDTKKVDDCVRRMAAYISSLKGRSKEEIDAEIKEREGLI